MKFDPKSKPVDMYCLSENHNHQQSMWLFIFYDADYIIWWQQLIGKQKHKYKTKGIMISRSEGSNWSRKRKSNAATVWLRCQQTVRAIFSGLFVRKNQSQIQTKTLVMYDDYSEGIELQCWGGTIFISKQCFSKVNWRKLTGPEGVSSSAVIVRKDLRIYSALSPQQTEFPHQQGTKAGACPSLVSRTHTCGCVWNVPPPGKS